MLGAAADSKTEKCQTACKPGSVRTIRHETAIPLGRASRHASRDQPGRQDGNIPAPCPRKDNRRRPYSVLLPVGFTLPPLLPGARCAFTAPFRPFPREVSLLHGRFVFCGTVPGVAPAGRYPAPYFRGARTFLHPRVAPGTAAVRPSGEAGMRAEAGVVKGPGIYPSNGNIACNRVRVPMSAAPVTASGRQ